MKIFLVFLILPLELFSQTTIDEIRSDSDVINFIRTIGPDFVDSNRRKYMKPVTFDIFSRTRIDRERMDTADGHFTDTIMAKRWIVEDLTGDQKKDLVFYGRIGSETGVFVFVHGTGNSGHLLQLTDMFASAYPHSIALYKKGNDNLLILGSLEHPEWMAKKQRSMRERFYRDTLIYRFGYFTNYNEAPQRGSGFDSIHYGFTTNWVAVNKWYLRIYKNGTVIYVRERDSVDRPNKQVFSFVEKLAKKIDPAEWREILEYIKFDKLNDEYELKNVTDLSTKLTTVYFTNGTKKTVRDYGARGTFGLQTLYHKFYALTQSHDWELVKKLTGYLFQYPEF